MSQEAAATIGPDLSWFRDTKTVRARRKPAGRPRPSTRLQTVRSLQATAYDSWDGLAPGARHSWSEVSGWRRHNGLAGSWRMDPRLEWARRAQVQLDRGGALANLAPGDDRFPLVASVSALRVDPAGGVRLVWANLTAPPPGSFVQFGIGPPAVPGHRPLKTWPVRVLGYAPAAAGEVELTVLPSESRYVLLRPFSRSCHCPRCYIGAPVPPW